MSFFGVDSMKKICLLILKLIITGICIGLMISGFLYVSHIFIHFSVDLFTQKNLPLILLFALSSFIFAYISSFLLSKDTYIVGSGIPQLEGVIKKDWKNPRWYVTIPLLILNSWITFFCGLSLGGEGPCVALGGNMAIASNQICKQEDKEFVAIGCGVGFGCALLAPLTGIVYIYEECLHHFSYKSLWKAILVMASAYLVIYFLHNEPILPIVVNESIEFSKSYIYLGLIPLCTLLGILFNKFVLILKDFTKKHENNWFISHRIYFIFLISILILVFYPLLSGSGNLIISKLFEFKNVFFVLLLLFLKFILILLGNNSSATGGIVIPIFTLGGLLGLSYGLIFIFLAIIDLSQLPILVMVSMITLFSVINQSPLTSIVLIGSLIGWPLFMHFEVIIPIIIVILCSHYLSKFFLKTDLYDSILEKLSE